MSENNPRGNSLSDNMNMYIKPEKLLIKINIVGKIKQEKYLLR